jgi:hypothetical protein
MSVTIQLTTPTVEDAGPLYSYCTVIVGKYLNTTANVKGANLQPCAL